MSPGNARQLCMKFLASQLPDAAQVSGLSQQDASLDFVISAECFGVPPFFIPRGALPTFLFVLPVAFIRIDRSTLLLPSVLYFLIRFISLARFLGLARLAQFSFARWFPLCCLVCWSNAGIHLIFSLRYRTRATSPTGQTVHKLRAPRTNNLPECCAAAAGPAAVEAHPTGGLAWGRQDEPCGGAGQGMWARTRPDQLVGANRK